MGYCKLLGGGINIGKYVWRRLVGHSPEQTIHVSFSTIGIVGNYMKIQVHVNEGFTFTDVITAQDSFTELFLSNIRGVYNSSGIAFTAYYRWHVLNNGDMIIYEKQSGNSMESSRECFFDTTTGILTINVYAQNYASMSMSEAMYTPFDLTKSEIEGTTTAYVVSNMQNAYPADGAQMGYWYQILASADSANTLSLTDAATTTIKNIAIEEVQQEVTI